MDEKDRFYTGWICFSVLTVQKKYDKMKENAFLSNKEVVYEIDIMECKWVPCLSRKRFR